MRSVAFLFLVSSLFCSNPTDYFSFAGGCFNIMREKHRTAEIEIEWKPGIRWSPWNELTFRPVLGLMGTILGSAYVYGGINFDVLFFDHLLFAPGFAAGYYARGGGKNLGYPLEFRSGVELAWQFNNKYRLGIHFYHLSNASLGNKNPGEESLVIYYDIPLVKGFPFIRD